MRDMMKMMESMLGRLKNLETEIGSVTRNQSGQTSPPGPREEERDVQQRKAEPIVLSSDDEVSVRTPVPKPVRLTEGSTLSIGVAHKIYAQELGEDRVSQLGDS